MNVLLVHNHYRYAGGEDAVLEAECRLLEGAGHRVSRYARHNDEIREFSPRRRVALLWEATWSRISYREIRALVRRQRPDVVHVHNVVPLITPSVYYACRDERVPVVQTLHNFRLLCPSALLLRNGRICEECPQHSLARSVRHACYRRSRVQTMAVARMLSVHRRMGTWQSKVDAYIALTRSCHRTFAQYGVPAGRLFVKPNFLASPPEPSSRHQGFVLFLGRLSVEKGLHTLLRASQRFRDIPLKIAGDGPLREELRCTAKANALEHVDLLGHRPASECLDLLGAARFLVMPSEWYETFGLTLVEAFACGKPVVASRLGAMAELVEHGRTGLLFEPGNAQDLADKVRWMVENEDVAMEMGRNARAVFEEKYTAERNYEMLIGIYGRVVEPYAKGC